MPGMNEKKCDAKNYKLTLSYNGANFCGFARQPEQLTVQGDLERALSTLTREPIETVCAGRTDAGVHAREQVVNFFTSMPDMTAKSKIQSLNALTHDDIAVKAIEQVDDDFSARFSVNWREYRYFISNGSVPPIFEKDFSWWVPKELNLDAMREGASHLIGEHDFKSFCLAASSIDKTTTRCVHEISIDKTEFFGEELVCIKVVGNAFLHSMVRTIVGTLALVGHEKRDPEWVKDVLNAQDRRAAGENAPACGLVFWHVEYN